MEPDGPPTRTPPLARRTTLRRRIGAVAPTGRALRREARVQAVSFWLRVLGLLLPAAAAAAVAAAAGTGMFGEVFGLRGAVELLVSVAAVGVVLHLLGAQLARFRPVARTGVLAAAWFGIVI